MADLDQDYSTSVDWRAIPPELDSYRRLDLSPSGELVHDLYDRLQHDQPIGRDARVLTDDQSTAPAGLTSEMATWYSARISGPRRAAIEAVRARFGSDQLHQIPTVLLEAERDELAHRCNTDKQTVLNNFEREHVELRRRLVETDRVYQAAKARHGGREPVEIAPAAYWIGLVVFSIAECGLNFETFAHAPWIPSPFLATFVTIFIAVGLGLASHLHGSLLRQWNWYFGPQDKERRQDGLKLLAIGTTAATVSLGVVAAARYYYLLPQIDQAQMLGQSPPNMVMFVTTAMAGNVIGYLLGAWWAYHWHDPDPDYPKTKRDADRARRQFDETYRAQVTDEIARLDAGCAQGVADLAARDRHQQASPNYEYNRRLFALLREQDEHVLAALAEYRTRLAREAPGARYRYPDRNVVTRDQYEEIGAQAWSTKLLTMKYHGATR